MIFLPLGIVLCHKTWEIDIPTAHVPILRNEFTQSLTQTAQMFSFFSPTQYFREKKKRKVWSSITTTPVFIIYFFLNLKCGNSQIFAIYLETVKERWFGPRALKKLALFLRNVWSFGAKISPKYLIMEIFLLVLSRGCCEMFNVSDTFLEFLQRLFSFN